jgi:hypothetical protein
MVRDSKFGGRQTRYLRNEYRLGVVTCLQKDVRQIFCRCHAEALGRYGEEIALFNIGARHIAPRHTNVEGSIVRPMADWDHLRPFQQSLADSRLFRRFAERGSYGIFSNGRAATSLNRVHKTARQRLEAGTGIVLAGDEHDMAEIIQKDGICRVPEMYGDLFAIRRRQDAKRMNGLIGVVPKVPVYGSSDDFLLHRRIDQHIVFDKTAGCHGFPNFVYSNLGAAPARLREHGEGRQAE